MPKRTTTAPPATDEAQLVKDAEEPQSRARWWRIAKIALQIGIPAIVVYLVAHEIHSLNIHQVRGVVAQADRELMLLGTAAALLAVCVMGFYDAIAFPRGASGTLGFFKRWMMGAVLFGWTNFVSMGPIGGPAMRVFAYRRSGLTAPEITRGFVGHYIGSMSGLFAWLIAVWIPGLHGPLGYGSRAVIALVGSITLSTVVGRLGIRIIRKHSIGTELAGVPLARLGLVSFVECGLTLLSFWLLTKSVGVSLDAVNAARTVFTGQVAGILSMIPGGIGSADAVWFHAYRLLDIPHDSAAAGILIFRAGYYLIPWSISFVAIYIVLAMNSEFLCNWQRRLVAGAVMLNAMLLLISAATPAVRVRLDSLAKFVPLGAIEVSHAVATVSALMMLLLVRGLLRGYRSAFLLTLTLLGASVIAHLLKGGDFEESAVSLVLLLMLLGVRGAFVRKGRIPVGWELTLAACIGGLSLFLISGFAAFDRVHYHPELWTDFAEMAEASRFLRASVLLGFVVIVALVRQAMRPVNLWVVPEAEDVERAEAFAREFSNSADPLLVGAGDKGIWFYEPSPGTIAAMILYQRHGDKLIVFKDPVLRPGEDPAKIINAFLRYGEELDVDVVFSMISAMWMSHLHDFGYRFLKVNEEGIVPLTGFTLQGGHNAGFRRNIREMDKAGIKYEVLAPPFDQATIDQLRVVSDTWIDAKGGRELQFSACYFSPKYIQRNPIAIARDSEGRIIAFVNILTTRVGGPATLDFMRYIPGVVDNIMDFLMIRTMETLAAEGYTSFSLGGAPLSDVGVWKGSRIPERMMHIFSTKAERFYNYQGLLKYKNKFHPQWEPRYMAYEQPWDWASSLYASTRLVQARSRADKARIAQARLGADH
mgnify:FL=1|tara:strand:+ start:243604 stop:246225 length:2622 start_codon:yes stop_codon:yes gene_type:complete